MPNYQGHLIGGALTYLAVSYVVPFTHLSWEVHVGNFLACMLGALFPDIDTKSKGQKIFYSVVALLMGVLLIKQRYDIISFVSVIALLPLMVRHRGLFHKLWFLAFCASAIAVVITWMNMAWQPIGLSLALYFFLGALSHIVLDQTFTAIKYMN